MAEQTVLSDALQYAAARVGAATKELNAATYEAARLGLNVDLDALHIERLSGRAFPVVTVSVALPIQGGM